MTRRADRLSGEHRVSAAERVYRARRIGLTFGRVYLGIKAQQFIERRLQPPDMERRWSAQHRSSAESVYEVAIELRGLILKGCQYLGARADLLPQEWVSSLSRLQDRVPAQPLPVVRRCVERELGAPLADLFREFSPKPVASASLAQVHEAVLHDGRRVAVKVQYPDIAAQVRGDLANLRTLFQAVGLLERELDLMPIIDELGTVLPRELDFLSEGRNAERVAKQLSHRKDVVVPEIIWEYTTPRVLVMQFLDGIKITDRERLDRAGVDRHALARTLVDLFSEQILGHGFFHADPHPGNVFVQAEGPRIVLFDFGLSKELPPRFREGILTFFGALLKGDAEPMGRALVDLGFETRDGSSQGLHAIAALILQLGGEIRRQGSIDPELLERLRKEVPDRIRANPVIRVPHHLVLLGRVVGLLAGVTRTLQADVDLFRVVAPHAAGLARPE